MKLQVLKDPRRKRSRWKRSVLRRSIYSSRPKASARVRNQSAMGYCTWSLQFTSLSPSLKASERVERFDAYAIKYVDHQESPFIEFVFHCRSSRPYQRRSKDSQLTVNRVDQGPLSC